MRWARPSNPPTISYNASPRSQEVNSTHHGRRLASPRVYCYHLYYADFLTVLFLFLSLSQLAIALFVQSTRPSDVFHSFLCFFLTTVILLQTHLLFLSFPSSAG